MHCAIFQPQFLFIYKKYVNSCKVYKNHNAFLLLVIAATNTRAQESSSF